MADPKNEIEVLKAALAAKDAQMERLIGMVGDLAGPTDASLNGLSPAAQKKLNAAPKPQKYRVVKGKSADTGSTFDMYVLESKEHKTGRVVRLENYQYPAGIEYAQSQGGLAPDGLNIRNKNVHDGFDPMYKQWRYQNFWRADLNNIAAGQALKSVHCVDPADIERVPWLESKIWGSEEAA